MTRSLLAYRQSCGVTRQPVRHGLILGMAIAQIIALASILWWLT